MGAFLVFVVLSEGVPAQQWRTLAASLGVIGSPSATSRPGERRMPPAPLARARWRRAAGGRRSSRSGAACRAGAGGSRSLPRRAGAAARPGASVRSSRVPELDHRPRRVEHAPGLSTSRHSRASHSSGGSPVPAAMIGSGEPSSAALLPSISSGVKILIGARFGSRLSILLRRSRPRSHARARS
jgi:hypothetical protein